MGDVVEHKQLLKKIEQTYPEMDQSGCLKVYSNLLKCVERKHLVSCIVKISYLFLFQHLHSE